MEIIFVLKTVEYLHACLRTYVYIYFLLSTFWADVNKLTSLSQLLRRQVMRVAMLPVLLILAALAPCKASELFNTFNGPSSKSKIVGGEEVEPNSIPYQVSFHSS